jgi:hypothetical protein
MADLTAQKTLVKSPPELWTELSEVESLAKHLGELGEITITRVEPESTVAWEGEQVSGTVELEQSGWGTKVTFRATVPEPGPAVETQPDPVAEAEPLAAEAGSEPLVAEADPEPDPRPAEPEPVTEPEALAVESESIAAASEPAPKRQGFFGRWFFRQRAPQPEPVAADPDPVVAPDPEPIAAVVPDSEPIAVAEPDPEPPATTVDADRVQRVLEGTLEALGQAHHRPFSRG